MKRLAALFTLISLGSAAQTPSAPPAADYAEASNRLAFASFSGLAQIAEGNFGFSPFNSHQVAALLAEGAKGRTQEELLKLTQLPADAATRLQWLATLREQIASDARRGGLALENANSLWSQPSYTFLPSFLEIARNSFSAVAEELTSTDPVQQAVQVNRWIRQQTRDRITNIVGPSQFANPQGTLLVVSSLYFRCRWSDDFDIRQTRMGPFILPDNKSIPLPIIRQTATVPYAEDDDWQCIDLQFKSMNFALRILLPRRDSDRATFETNLTSRTWTALGEQMSPEPTHILIPRFSFATELDLAPLWAAIIPQSLFQPGVADLSALAKASPSVSAVIHSSTIEVTESGIEATAATVGVADPFGDPPPPPKREVEPKIKLFNADHPFLWFVVHRPTHLVLFAGRFTGETPQE